MDINQLREELTKRGISFAANAGLANLQGKLDEALALEAEAMAKQVAGADLSVLATGSETAPTPPPELEVVVKPGAATGAAPAAAAATAPAAPEEIPELEILAKMRAGLTREQAVEVISNQRAHDKGLEG